METRRVAREQRHGRGRGQALCREAFPREQQAAHAPARGQPAGSPLATHRRGHMDESRDETAGQGQAEQLHRENRLSRQMEGLQRPAGRREPLALRELRQHLRLPGAGPDQPQGEQARRQGRVADDATDHQCLLQPHHQRDLLPRSHPAASIL